MTLARKYLDPGERIGEILFGLIMVLTFTLAAGLTIREEGAEGARQLLFAAIGCNVAWGIIDGAMYIMGNLLERSRRAALLRRVREAADTQAGFERVGEALEETLAASATGEEQRDLYRIVHKIALRTEPEAISITKDDILGAIACFWLVFLSTVPAAIPFLLTDEPFRALRVSNLLLVLLLFWVGYAWGKHAGVRRWLSGLIFLTVGVILVAVAIRLGG